MKTGAAVAAGRGVEATEEQARAIIATVKKAVEKAKIKMRADGASSAAGKKPSSSSSSLKRSLECFLEGRKNKALSSSAATRCHHLESSTTASSSSSSSSNS